MTAIPKHIPPNMQSGAYYCVSTQCRNQQQQQLVKNNDNKKSIDSAARGVAQCKQRQQHQQQQLQKAKITTTGTALRLQPGE